MSLPAFLTLLSVGSNESPSSFTEEGLKAEAAEISGRGKKYIYPSRKEDISWFPRFLEIHYSYGTMGWRDKENQRYTHFWAQQLNCCESQGTKWSKVLFLALYNVGNNSTLTAFSCKRYVKSALIHSPPFWRTTETICISAQHRATSNLPCPHCSNMLELYVSHGFSTEKRNTVFKRLLTKPQNSK